MAPNTEKTTGLSSSQIGTSNGKQQLPSSKDKTDHESRLGTYKSTITPLLVMTVSLTFGNYSFFDVPRDERTKGWFLADSQPLIIAICVLYIFASMVWGPRYMANRKPMTLSNFMLMYNAFQVFFSAYMFVKSGLAGWFFDYNYRCEPCNFSSTGKPMMMAEVSNLFFLSKLLDFVDTALFIARGKLNQVSNLHVIHHSCMVISMWFVLVHVPGGHFSFVGFLNSFIHTVMYSYYLLAGLGPKVQPYLWWKKYLTRMQLIQFVVVFIHTAQLLWAPCQGFPLGLVYWTLLYAILFFGLFLNFYIQAYLKGSKKKAASAVRDADTAKTK